MDSQDLRNLSEAYNSVYEATGRDEMIAANIRRAKAQKPSSPTTTTAPKPTGPVAQAPKPNVGGVLGQLDKMARRTAGEIGGRIGEREGRNRTGNIPVISDIGGAIGRNKGREQGQKTYDNLKNTATQALGGLLKQDYEYDIDEMAMNPNSRFTTAAQRKEYSANQIGSKEFSDRGGYSALKAGGGQAALKSGSSVSDVLHAGKRAVTAKKSQEFRSARLQRLSGANKPAATAPTKKPMDDFAAGGGNAKMKATGMTRDQVIAQGKKNLANSYEPDNFDVILEYLVAEGYADTNQNALVIMANMSEEWRDGIMEGYKRYPAKKVGKKLDRMYNDPDTDTRFGKTGKRYSQMMTVDSHMKGEVHPLIRAHSPKKSKAKEAENRKRGNDG
jgi:hypothetical protein